MNRNNLAAYRKLIGLKQTDMAKKIKVTPTTYSRKESGKSDFTETEMILITETIKGKIPDVTMDDIFNVTKISKIKTAT